MRTDGKYSPSFIPNTPFTSKIMVLIRSTYVITLNYSTLHCTALHCTALHCTALHCTALHCTALHCTALHCTALHCTALHCTALHTAHCTLHTTHYTLVRFQSFLTSFIYVCMVNIKLKYNFVETPRKFARIFIRPYGSKALR